MSDPQPIRHFDQSTFLAARVEAAAELDPPGLPQHVALPGAKAAIERDRLDAYLETGLLDHQVAARVNERWEGANADRLKAHKQWVAGPYAHALERMRELELERAAEEQRRRAIWEEIVQEREAQDASDS